MTLGLEVQVQFILGPAIGEDMQRYVCIILLVIFGSIGILLWIKPQYVVSVVKSDSMQPTLHRGDLLIAQLQFEPQLQDIVFVQVSYIF